MNGQTYVYTDEKGYERGSLEHSNLIHRQIAYKEIYLKNRKKYKLPFSRYVIHHKDGDKQNNLAENLEILTPIEHERVHTVLTSSGKKKTSKKSGTKNILLRFYVFHAILFGCSYSVVIYKFFLDYLKLELLPVLLVLIFLFIIPYWIILGWWTEIIRDKLAE